MTCCCFSSVTWANSNRSFHLSSTTHWLGSRGHTHTKEQCGQPCSFCHPLYGLSLQPRVWWLWVLYIKPWMQTLQEYVLMFVSSPVMNQLVCLGKTAGGRRDFNFYWFFNGDEKESSWNTWSSSGGLEIPDLSCLQGRHAVGLLKRLSVCMCLVGEGGEKLMG